MGMYNFRACHTDYKKKKEVQWEVKPLRLGLYLLDTAALWNHSLTKIHRNEPQTSCPLCVCVCVLEVGGVWLTEERWSGERKKSVRKEK